MANLIGQSANPGVAGVLGESSIFNGVLGYTTADGHAGVAGACDEGNGHGVYGRSKNRNGVYGVSSAAEHSGVVGQNDNGTGVLGRSKNSRGVWGLSDTREGVIAQTKSVTTAALVAYQSNPSSPMAALYAKHDGKLTAAVFEGDVDISGNLKVQGVSIQSLLQRIQQLEQKVGVGPTPSQRTISVPKEGAGTTTVFTVKGTGFTPNKLVVIKITAPNLEQVQLAESAGADGKFEARRSLPCATGLKLTFTAFEDANPTNTHATPVITTCP